MNHNSDEAGRNVILVGNKCDLEHARSVSTKEGADLAKKYNLAGFFETSAKTSHNIKIAFYNSILNCVKADVSLE